MMKIVDFITPAVINVYLQGADRSSVFKELIAMLTKENPGLDASLILRILEEREKLGSTGIGNGVAIPHGKVKGLRKVLVAVGRSAKAIDFDSEDGQPIRLFFLIVAPGNAVSIHLTLLARINSIAGIPELRQELMEAESAEDMMRCIGEFDPGE